MSLDISIERYVDTVFTGYQAALREVAATLAEPALAERDQLRRTGERLVETLTAFAIGHAIRRVLECLEPEPALLAELARTVLAIGVPRHDPSALPTSRFLADADRRPIVDAVAAALQVRICLGARHVRSVLRGVAATLTARAPDHATRLARALDRLADPISAFAFGDQLALGWQHFLAVVEHRADPEIPDEPRWLRGRALWTAWLHRVRGTRPPPPQELPRGYILRVA